MKNMRAIIYLGPKKLEMRELPVPEPAEDEVLVKVRCATTCGTDLKTYKRGYHHLKPPCGIGHEFSGDVVEVGRDVVGFKPGMRVTAHNSAPCGTCFYCKHGQQNLCETPVFNYGTFREYHIIPGPIVRLNAFEIPEPVSYEQAPLVEPLSCVVHGHRVLRIAHGERVAIIGAGPIGLMHLQLALLSGAVEVISVDLSDTRLKTARKLGATHTVNAEKEDPVRAIRDITNGRGVDVAIEAAGDLGAWNTAFDSVRKGGRVEFFGGLKENTPVELDTYRIHYGELTLHGTFHSTPLDVQRAFDLIVSGVVDTLSLISDESPLEKVEEALQRMDTREVIKIAIKPDLSVDV